jgi:hypothetical protein
MKAGQIMVLDLFALQVYHDQSNKVLVREFLKLSMNIIDKAIRS